jgi:hypothetical protein
MAARDTPSPRLRGEGRGEGLSWRLRSIRRWGGKLPLTRTPRCAASDLSPQAREMIGARSILSPARKLGQTTHFFRQRGTSAKEGVIRGKRVYSVPRPHLEPW